MKWAIVCVVILAIQAIIISAQFDVNLSGLSKSEQIAQYESQLAQLKSMQMQEFPANPTLVELNTAAEASTTTGADQSKLKKLKAAMAAVKEDIMAKLREAQRESKWVKEVEEIVKQYKKKVKNVKKNLTKIRQDIKELIKKKRQIRNAQIQEQLQDRLSDANGDLQLVKNKLESINAQQKAFEQNRKKIADTIAKINSELAHLRGEKPAPTTTTPAAENKDTPAAPAKTENKAAAPKKGEKLKQHCESTCNKDAACADKCVKDTKEMIKNLSADAKQECKKKCDKDFACLVGCAKEKSAPKSSLVELSTDEELLAEFA